MDNPKTIGQMTQDDLIALIVQIVDRRLKQEHSLVSASMPWEFFAGHVAKPQDEHFSPSRLLQEERDQWYKPTS